jgi:hypothetical protein
MRDVDEIRGVCMHAALEAFASRPRSPWRFAELLAVVKPLEGLFSHTTIIVDRGRLRRALRWSIEWGNVRKTASGYRLTKHGARSIAAGRHNRRIYFDKAARRRAERLSDRASRALWAAEADRIWRKKPKAAAGARR